MPVSIKGPLIMKYHVDDAKLRNSFEPASNQPQTSSEPASVMEFGFNQTHADSATKARYTLLVFTGRVHGP